ncbi:unnamed protein product [Parajaminaea phylloscopi]
MLRNTLVRATQHVRRPMIKFPDRTQAQDPHTPHPHPAAPKQIAENFEHFQETFRSGPHFDPKKLQSLEQASDEARSQFGQTDSQPGAGTVNKGKGAAGSSSSSSSPSSSSSQGVVEDLHDLPPRFWRKPIQFVDEAEMEAVMSGGASVAP